MLLPGVGAEEPGDGGPGVGEDAGHGGRAAGAGVGVLRAAAAGVRDPAARPHPADGLRPAVRRRVPHVRTQQRPGRPAPRVGGADDRLGQLPRAGPLPGQRLELGAHTGERDRLSE